MSDEKLTRRDNVEYHQGRDAYHALKPITDCPYGPTAFHDSRHLRWCLGWEEAKKGGK